MTFTTITEHAVLSLAWHELMNRKQAQLQILTKYPDSQIAKRLIGTYNAQIEEVNAHILEIEASQQS